MKKKRRKERRRNLLSQELVVVELVGSSEAEAVVVGVSVYVVGLHSVTALRDCQVQSLCHDLSEFG